MNGKAYIRLKTYTFYDPSVSSDGTAEEGGREAQKMGVQNSIRRKRKEEGVIISPL